MSSPIEDPGLWKQISAWLWTLLALPVASLWKKVDNAVLKEDFKEFIKASREADETLRETTKELFRNAEADRAAVNEKFNTMQETIHRMHVDLLSKIR